MARFISVFPVELKDAPRRVNLPTMFSSDAGANRIGARVTSGGQPVALSVTCEGLVIKPDGTKVEITGTVDGNEAYITLPSGAYSVPGVIKVYVTVRGGGQVTTLLEGAGMVRGVS